MSRLPPALQPWWPLFKRLHLLLSVCAGVVFRRLGFILGDRRLPRRGYATSRDAARAEPATVTLHEGPPVPAIARPVPDGEPPGHWVFMATARRSLPDLSLLEAVGGVVVGDLGAVITPGGGLDLETSHYWDVAHWRQHPLFLHGRLPVIEEYAGSVAVLGTRGGGASYYHFLLDVLPRLEVLRRVLPAEQPDAYYLPRGTRYHEEILELAGLDAHPVIESSPDRAIRAARLLVPALPNHDELTPRWVVDWLRSRLAPGELDGRPRRLYVTRGQERNTRRYDQELEVWPELARRGFVRVDPGTMSVRDQIDTFAAAEVIVGVHGAALTNLVFCSPGVRVLHLMAPQYVKHCFWAILDSIPEAQYRYLVGDGTPVPPGGPMRGVQDDISIAPERLLRAVDELLG